MKTKLLDEKTCNLINEAISKELYASNMYKHIANQLQNQGFFGAQKYFLGESEDELKHYQILVDFLNDMGDVAKVPNIPLMKEPVEGMNKALKIAYDQEVDLMEFYSGLCDKVDAITYQFLLQFIEIQRKSVGEYGDLIARLSLLKNDPAGLIIFDQELNGL